MAKFNNPTQYTGRQSNKYLTGATRAANATEAAAGDAENLYISPSTLSSAVGDLVPSATTLIEGVVLITDNSSPVATKAYADALAIAGAPAWSESVSGIGQLSTNAEAVAGTNDDTAMTPLKVAAVLAAPPAIGSGTPAAGSFTTLAASGLASLSASATIETGATDLNLASDASTGAVNLGTGAGARAITIGNVTGATGVTVNTGTGHFTVNTTGAGDIILNSDDTVLIDADGVLELNSSAGVISIGNDADANNINVGTGAAARTITIGNSTGATSVVIESGTGAINIGANAIAHSVTVGNKTGASAVVVEVGTGNFSLDGVAGSTYSIGASTTTGTVTIGGTAQTGNFNLGVSSGIMTANLVTGDGAKTLNIATGVSGNTVNLASGVNTSAQVINISTGASAANSTVNVLSGNGSAGTQTLNVLTGTRAGALNLATGAAAHVIAVGSASAGAVTVDSSAGISIDAGAASNFSVSGAGVDLDLASSGGRIIVTAGEDAADAIYLRANAGTSETIRLHADQGTGVASIGLVSDVGGITLSSGLASADAINLSASAGGIDVDGALQVNIASSQAAASAIVINASNATGGIDLQTGGGSIDLSSAGFVTMVPGTSTAAAATGTVNANVGVVTCTGLTTASAASQVFTITNSLCTVNSAILVSASNLGANDAQMTVTRVVPGAGSFTVTLTNNGAAALNGDVIITFWIIAA